MDLLKIQKLTVEVGGRRVLQNLDLTLRPHEITALMGPNGSGKSSLAMTIMGHEEYKIVSPPTHKLNFEGHELAILAIEERAKLGIYVAWQNPVDIPGVPVFQMLKASYLASGMEIKSLVAFKRKLEKLAIDVGLTPEHIVRNVNEGFSGGERKRLEILQILLLTPKLIVLDEIDSGLDIDALRMVAKKIKTLSSRGAAIIVISHYARLFEQIKPHKVLVINGGKIVDEGGAELVTRVDRRGYLGTKSK